MTDKKRVFFNVQYFALLPDQHWAAIGRQQVAPANSSRLDKWNLLTWRRDRTLAEARDLDQERRQDFEWGRALMILMCANRAEIFIAPPKMQIDGVLEVQLGR